MSKGAWIQPSAAVTNHAQARGSFKRSLYALLAVTAFFNVCAAVSAAQLVSRAKWVTADARVDPAERAETLQLALTDLGNHYNAFTEAHEELACADMPSNWWKLTAAQMKHIQGLRVPLRCTAGVVSPEPPTATQDSEFRTVPPLRRTRSREEVCKAECDAASHVGRPPRESCQCSRADLLWIRK